jgi:hypothetical protein
MNGDAMNARSDDGHALGEGAVDADNGFVARLEGVDYRGLDAARTAGRERQGHAVVGLKELAEEYLHFADHLDKPRVHVTDHRGRNRA